MSDKSDHRIFRMKFVNVYPLYVQKGERKNRTKEEVDQIILWLTGYNQAELQQQLDQGNDLEAFFGQAPALNPNVALIKGVVCGVRVEEIDDPSLVKTIQFSATACWKFDTVPGLNLGHSLLNKMLCI